MIIRPEQVQSLSQAQRRDFEDRACNYFRKWYPRNPQVCECKNLRSLVQAGTEKAAGYYITREIDVVRFLELQLVLGTDFDMATTYSKILLRDIAPEERLDEIVERARFGDPTTR